MMPAVVAWVVNKPRGVPQPAPSLVMPPVPMAVCQVWGRWCVTRLAREGGDGRWAVVRGSGVCWGSA